MYQKMLKCVLKWIRKNAVHGAGTASDYGTFETEVPDRLKKLRETSDNHRLNVKLKRKRLD